VLDQETFECWCRSSPLCPEIAFCS